jgi:hypothetical protein
MFFWCLSLETDGFLATFCWRLFLLASVSLGTPFSWDLLSWHLLCFEVVVHSHAFPVASFTFSPDTSFFWNFRNLLANPLCYNTRLPQSTSSTTKLPQSAPSTTLYYKTCKKYFPVLLRTTKLAQGTSQYYFVLRNLRKILPSTTCAIYFPVLLCTTRLAQKGSQNYFVLQGLHKYQQNLHKTFPNNTFYKACTKYFPALLCTTSLAQSTSQYYFVLQDSHKVLLVLPSTTSYYKNYAKSTFQY